jgi:hypothetical protein
LLSLPGSLRYPFILSHERYAMRRPSVARTKREDPSRKDKRRSRNPFLEREL